MIKSIKRKERCEMKKEVVFKYLTSYQIDVILNRIKSSQYSMNIDSVSTLMDLAACNRENGNDFFLDIDRLLEFPDFDFWHDILGLKANMDRTSGLVINCFIPRCAELSVGYDLFYNRMIKIQEKR